MSAGGSVGVSSRGGASFFFRALGPSISILLLLTACGTQAPLESPAPRHLEDPIAQPQAPSPFGNTADATRDGILHLSPSEPLEGALLAAVRFFDALIRADRYRLDAALEDNLLRVNPRATSYTRSKPSLLGIFLHPSRRAQLREGWSIHDLFDLERSRSIPLKELYPDALPAPLEPIDRAFELHFTPEGVRAFRGSLPSVNEKFIVLIRGEPPHRIIGL